MKNPILFLLIFIGVFIATSAQASGWQLILRANQSYSNYGQINGYIICEQCIIRNYGQINATIDYR